MVMRMDLASKGWTAATRLGAAQRLPAEYYLGCGAGDAQAFSAFSTAFHSRLG
jgi:hypothetical protein